MSIGVVIEELFEAFVYAGIPLIIFLASCYFLFWRANYKMFWGLNIVVCTIYTILAFMFPGSNDPPVPKMALVLFIFFILPAYVLVCTIVFAIKYFSVRRRTKKSAGE